MFLMRNSRLLSQAQVWTIHAYYQAKPYQSLLLTLVILEVAIDEGSGK